MPGGERHPSAEPVWAAELHEVPAQGPWAGWLDAGPALRVSGDMHWARRWARLIEDREVLLAALR